MSAVRSKVLIVEDEAMLVMSLEMLIEAHGGFDVAGTAAGATRALEIAATQRPDVALVDIQLAHGESGFDVAAELRRQGVTCLFMTGNPPDEPHPDLAIGVLAKPFGRRRCSWRSRWRQRRRRGGSSRRQRCRAGSSSIRL